jgi:indole-3-glycerol phosphate synthase
VAGAPTNLLSELLAARRRRVEQARAEVPLERHRRAAEARMERRDFAAALREPGLRIIAEMKQASPSRGVLRTDYRPRKIAQAYEAAGAAALSVLTEEEFFRGALNDLVDAREAVLLPVLRKDFILDAYQLWESAAAGADAVLLIVAALEASELGEFLELARRLRLEALVEVHDEEELARALDAGARIVGVNNRDLKTFELNLETSFRLRPRIPAECLAVSESGIGSSDDLRRLAEAGYHAALIGEHFMKAPDPGSELARLLEGSTVSSQG